MLFALLVLYNAKRQRVLIYLSILIYIVAIFSHTVNLFIFPLIIFYIHKFSLFYKKNIIYTSITLSVLAYIGLIFSPIFSEKFFDSKIWCTNLISNFNLNNSCNDLLAGNMIEFKQCELFRYCSIYIFKLNLLYFYKLFSLIFNS